jgi:predicted phage terminase large subunit-like protein
MLEPLTPEEIQAAQILARLDLYVFSRLMMRETAGVVWQPAPHHRIICDVLMRVFRGESRRVIINCPPRYSKTQLLLNFVLWSLGQVPDSEYIFTSYSSDLAATNSWKAREDVKSEIYRAVFPDVALDTSSTAKDHWRTTKGGVIYARGAGGSITGFGAGKMREGFGGAIIVDDPHKPDEAHSDTVRRSVLRWFSNTLENRVNSPNTPIILIMQRLHEEDCAGWLLDGGNGEEWESVVLPAIQEDGTALWPEKHTIEDLRRMETASPYAFAGQYLQRPTPIGGGMIKPDAMNVLDSAPQIVASVRAWDLASTHNDGDWTVGVLLGRTRDNRFVILDVRRLQGGPDEVEAAICATAQMDGRRVKIGLPIDPGAAGKSANFYLTKALAGFAVISSPESGDKATRAGPVAAQINIGNVDMVRAEWNAALKNEMMHFPFGKHDDQVDALSRAFGTLTERPRGVVVTDDILKAVSLDRPRVIGGIAGLY